MLKIRLARVGKRNSPIFRLVVAEKARAVKRQNIEILGLYNPGTKDNKFQVNKERVLFWIGKGAQPSPTVNNLLCDFAVLPKSKKVKIIFARAEKKKEIKKEKEKKPTAPAVKEDEEDKEDKEDKTAEETSEEPKVSEEVAESEVAEEESRPEADQPEAGSEEKSE